MSETERHPDTPAPVVPGSPPKILLAAAILVLASAVLFAWIAGNAFIQPPVRLHQLDFATARWIESPPSSPSGYFRKEFFLSSGARRACIQMAGSDQFQLFVNGRPLSAKIFFGVAPSGFFDITDLLQPGKNVLAAVVERSTYPGPAQLLARLTCRLDNGRTEEIVSDTSWKVNGFPETPSPGILWNATDTDDTAWPYARAADGGTTLAVQPVTIRPEVLQLPLTGFWIASQDPAATTALYTRRFSPALKGIDAWIRITTGCAYDLVINGQVIAITDQSGLGSKAYDLTPWAETGINRISIRARSLTEVPQILADGMVGNKAGPVTQFSTDKNWRSSQAEKENGGDEREIAVLQSADTRPGHRSSIEIPEFTPPFRSVLDRAARWAVVVAGSLLLFLATWVGVSLAVARIRGESLRTALRQDALLHAPLLPLMLVPLLLGYDVRLPADIATQPGFAWAILAVWALLRLLHFLPPASGQSLFLQPVAARRALPFLLLGLIVGMGAFLRFHDLGFMSIDHDEQLLIDCARGIHTNGLPWTDLGYTRKYLATYELCSYSIALSTAIFGWSEWAIRTPSAVFGTLTILLVGLFGRRLAGWRVGILGAAIYTFLPTSVQWAQNCFWPQQAQFFCLLTFWMFWEAIQEYPFRRKYLVLGSIGCLVSYFSWEGSGFMIPALSFTILFWNWGRWSWMIHPPLWWCLFFTGSPIILQLCYRKLVVSAYLMVGSGLSEVDTPSLFFLDSMYTPDFYFRKFLLLENHFFLTLIVLVGLPAIWKRRGLLFAALLGFFFVLFYTNFLAATGSRYVHHVQPLLVLVASGIVVHWWDRISELAETRSFGGAGRWLGLFSRAGLAVAVMLATNGVLMKTYRLSFLPEIPSEMSRMNVYKFDYRNAFGYIVDHLLPGDIVIPGPSNLYNFYTGKTADYFVNTAWGIKVLYIADREVPRFIDKYAGATVMRDVGELKDVQTRAARTWVVICPRRSYDRINAPFVEYVEANARVVFESYDSRVYLLEGVPPNPPAKVAADNP